MKAVVLAAGYATRLYPLTENFPKPLLPIAKKAIMSHILEKIIETKIIDKVYVVTNNRFYPHFVDWAESIRGTVAHIIQIEVINDGSNSSATRLGAIGDLHYLLEEANVFDDILLLAGDNLFDFSLLELTNFFTSKQAGVLSCYHTPDVAVLKRSGNVTLATDGRVIAFEEKPQEPKSNLVCPAFYVIPKSSLPLLVTYLYEKNNPDEIGRYIGWLATRIPFYGYILSKQRYDIGNLKSYESTNEIFTKRLIKEQSCVTHRKKL